MSASGKVYKHFLTVAFEETAGVREPVILRQ